MYHDMLIGHGDKDTSVVHKIWLKLYRSMILMNEVILDWWTYSDFERKLMFKPPNHNSVSEGP